MMPIMDIPFQTFTAFRQKNPVFFWMETSEQFVLLKPYNDAWLRVRINKTGGMSDFIWRDNNLAGGIQIGGVEGLDSERLLREILVEVKKPLEVNAYSDYRQVS